MKKNYIALIGLLLSLCFTSSATTPVELIFDSGFETFPVGVLTENSVPFATPKDYKMFKYMPGDQGATVVKEIIEFPTADPTKGWQCLKVTVSGSLSANYNALIINYSDGITLVPGKSYEVKYSVKTSAAIQASTIRIANSDGGGNDVTGFKYWHAGAAVSTPVNEWRDISFTYNAVESGATGYWDAKLAVGVSIQPIITPAQLNNAGGTISLYFDNFSIKEAVSTSTANLNESNESIYLSNKILYVSNSKASSYQIFDLAGVLVENGLITNHSFSKVLDLSDGIYIVKAGSKVVKVSLK